MEQSSISLPKDYHERAKELGFASPEQVGKALVDPSTVVLDVRSMEEVARGPIPSGVNFISTGCHACPYLEIMMEYKARFRSTPILVYCSSGRRAKVACARLKLLGYHNVLNAGGLKDVLVILAQYESKSTIAKKNTPIKQCADVDRKPAAKVFKTAETTT